MTKTIVVLALLTVGLALPRLAGQMPAVGVLLDGATNWVSTVASIARCPAAPGSGSCS